jgi:TonB family protein
MPNPGSSKCRHIAFWNAALALTLLASIAGAGQPASAQQDQHLTLIFGVWKPGTTPLQIEDFGLKNLLTDEDRALITKSVNGGAIKIAGGSSSNPAGLVSPRARMIVLFTGTLQQIVRLQQPDAAAALYVQRGQTFERFPPAAPLVNRAVEFVPHDQSNVRYFAERVGGGSGGTIGLSAMNSPSATASAARQSPSGGSSSTPTKIKDVAPVRPANAIAAGITGAVIVEILVDVTGRVAEARVLRSLPMLDQAALECVRQWEYTPAMVNGVATPIRMSATVQFSR